VKVSVNRLLAAKGLRAFGDGYVALLLPAYLIDLGFSPLEVGLIATTTLFGSGLLTLLVGLYAHRYHYRSLLLAATVLMAGTGLGFAFVTDFWPLLLMALIGTLNPSSGDVSVFLPLEHAALSHLVEDKRRTAVFARYSLVGSLVAALGSLAAGLPAWIADAANVSVTAGIQAMFVLYAMLAGLAAVVYRALPGTSGAGAQPRAGPLTTSKKTVHTLAALFSLDAFAGGFVVQSMVALWLYQKFSLSLAGAGTLFFWTGILTAGSYLVAARIASRFGLVRTMVFTHLPSSLCLVAIPFMPSLGYVIALLFVRSALSQMDVPTRSSYVMAIVPPAERPAAASITSVPRSLASAASPFVAGYLLGASSFGWPLLIAGTLKIAYDLLLLLRFGNVRPPEEQRAQGPEPVDARSGIR
jgi:MFS family permease